MPKKTIKSSKKKQQYVYKNVSDLRHTIMGVGVVEPGAEIKIGRPFFNPNFELQEK